MTDLTQGAPILGLPLVIPAEGSYLHNQRLGKLIDIDECMLDRGFAYYLFVWDGVRAQLRASATGATVRHTAPERIYRVLVPLPPLATQRKVAAILSAYDDLIQNNNRRIKLLEEMAQRIYREWFVDFRYPGHESGPLVESKLGPTLSGWEVADIASCSTLVSRGVSPKYDDDSSQLVVNQKCVRDGRLSLSLARRHSTRVPDEKIIRYGDVLINSTGVGTLGRVAQVLTPLQDTTIDSHVSIVRPNLQKMTTTYWGLNLIAREAEFAAMGAGSTGQTELNRNRIGGSAMLVPPFGVQVAFEEMVRPLRAMVTVLEGQIGSLWSARGLLLPRLISGEIDVDDLNIDIPEAA